MFVAAVPFGEPGALVEILFRHADSGSLNPLHGFLIQAAETEAFSRRVILDTSWLSAASAS